MQERETNCSDNLYEVITKQAFLLFLYRRNKNQLDCKTGKSKKKNDLLYTISNEI